MGPTARQPGHRHGWQRIANLCAIVLMLIAPPRASAHEIGTTRVAAFLDDSRYTIEITTDAASLVEKLLTMAGEDPSADPSPESCRAALTRLEDVFRGRVQLRFDGRDVRSEISYAVTQPTDASAAPLAVIRLTGAIQPGARAFTWTYGWTFASYALTVVYDGDPARTATLTAKIPAFRGATQWLEGGQTTSPIAVTAPPDARSSRVETAIQYMVLGFTHILPHGLDHVLFVLGLFLLDRRPRMLLWQVSAFTIAHSITLGLSMYGIVPATPSIVEPLIAISIAYVAIENVLLRELRPWRLVLVFVFGLLHGLGFAGVLGELGLPRGDFLTALLSFNVGVEAGQMTVIAAAFVLVGWRCGNRDWYRQRVVVPASLLIACTAAYWTIERLPWG
jgi:hypothetical protein